MNIYVMGSINTDLVIECDNFPLEGETVVGKNFIVNSGGKGANQAVAVAKSGKKPILIAGVGDDNYGKENIAILNSYGVDTSNIHIFEKSNTGVASIIISKGNNRIVLDLGANFLLNVNHYDGLLKNANRGDIFVVQMETDANNIKQGVLLAKQRGMTTILNPAPANKELTLELLPYVDFLIPNQVELATICDKNADNLHEIVDCARCLLDKGVGCVIVTIGSDGCVVIDKNNYYHIESNKVDAVDSTAAGDTFVGYFCSMLAEHKDVVSACRLANLAASITVTRRGAQQTIPYLSELSQ